MVAVRHSPETHIRPTDAPPPAAPQRSPGADGAPLRLFEASTFERVNGGTPGLATWRGPADSPVGRALGRMMRRLETSDVTIRGDTPSSLFRRAIIDNRRLSNAQILALENVKLEDLASSPENRERTLRRYPNVRSLPVHRFTVDLLAGATGVDPAALSQAAPSLGLTGSASTPLLFAARSERVQLSTALHDFTDNLRAAGLSGYNRAVFGVENQVLSAISSFLGFGRY